MQPSGNARSVTRRNVSTTGGPGEAAQPGVVQPGIGKFTVLPTRQYPPLRGTEQLIALLRIKAVQKHATTGLVKIGAASLPLLKQALARETDSRGFQSLAQVCAHLATPAARQLLVELAQGPNLVGRAAALRALSSFATEAADTPLFQRLVEE